MKTVSMGEGCMVYTAIYKSRSGDIMAAKAYGSPDRQVAWKQSKKKFQRVVALIPGNHEAILEPKIS